MRRQQISGIGAERKSWLSTIVLVAAALTSSIAEAEDSPAKPPRVAMCVPLGLAPNKTTLVTVRGWALDDVKEVTTTDPRVTVRILSAGAAAVPSGQDAKQVGDRQVELEFTVANGTEPGEIALTLVSPAGDSAPHNLYVGSSAPLIIEVEPNDGVRQAQQIAVPQVIVGQIQTDRSVDVYSFEIAASQRVTIETFARRRGSGLDSLLTLYSSRIDCIAVSDDLEGTTDSRISANLPAGRYFISLQDASDHGGPAHPYRLIVHTSE